MNSGPSPASGLAGDDRGLSNVVGYILLAGMIAVSIGVVVAVGTSALGGLQEQNAGATASIAFTELDSRLTSLSSEGSDGTSVRFTRDQFNRMDLAHNGTAGHVTVLVNGGTCNATAPMSSLRYENDGETLAYEVGGVFRQSPGSDSSVVDSPPDFYFEDGTVSLTTVNVSGDVTDRTVRFVKDANRSRNATETIERDLFYAADACRRPSNVTVKVTSAYYAAWAGHLGAQTGLDATATPGNRTARVHVPSSSLPRATDDSRNNVVNLTDDSVATVNKANGTIVVNKSAVGDEQEYAAFGEPLSEGVQVSTAETFENDVRFRAPIDIVFVVDESGSMSRDGPNGVQKRLAAQRAARNFTGDLNETFDRVGVVAYNDSARYIKSDGEFFSDDFAAVNDSINSTGADGGTHGNRGMYNANRVHELDGEPSQSKVVVFLTDGKNDDSSLDDRMVDNAEEARENGATVYTVGFGGSSDVDQDVLNDTAQAGGGETYLAENATALDAVFEDIFATITETNVIQNRPVTLNGTVGTRSYSSTVGDDVEDTATVTTNGTVHQNVNDPSLPPFSISMQTPDGDITDLNATVYGCDEYALTDAAVENSTTGEVFQEIRCVEINESQRTTIPPTNETIYLDGDSAQPIIDNASAWWEGDVRNDTLAPYLSGTTFDLQSNQAVVVFDFGGADGVKQRLVMLYEIGLSEQAATDEVINVEVVEANATAT